MTVPTAIPFSAVPIAGVISKDLVTYFIKCDVTTSVNLATGAINAAVSPTDQYTHFPSAAMVLGT